MRVSSFATSFLIGLALATATRSNAFALDVPDLAARMKPAVVLLTVTDSKGAKLATGTGFFVAPEGRIATNHHVLEGGSKVSATLADGRKLELAGTIADDEQRDLAVVQTVEHGPFPTLTLGDETTVRVGEDVVVYGNPMGLSGSLSTGVISAMREGGPTERDPALEDDPSLASWGIQITAAVSPGSSGSPVVVASGNVIGVAVGRLRGGAENVNFAVPVSSLKKMLAGASTSPRAFRPGERSVVQNLVISAGVIGGMGLAIVAMIRFANRKPKVKKPLGIDLSLRPPADVIKVRAPAIPPLQRAPIAARRR